MISRLRRIFAVPKANRVLLTVGTLTPSLLGASVIGVMVGLGLPTAADLGNPEVLRRNVLAAVIHSSVAVPLAIAWACWWMTTTVTDNDDFTRQRVLMSIPRRLTIVNSVVWTSAVVMLVAVNRDSPLLAITLGVSTLLGSAVTAALTYWWCARILRPLVAPMLTMDPPTRQRRPGLRLRAVSSWVIGTGVPLLMLMLIAASALILEYPGRRLALVVLGLGGAALLSGLVVAVFAATTTADPIDEVRRGMRAVERGHYDVTVPVFDASELGLLQAGFNTMVSGLREREQLRDLFGRHVGRDVAQLAERSVSQAGGETVIGGESREVAVVFVDLVGSTRLARQLPPHELVVMLNGFFAVVVDVVERNGGWVNKFEGDAALAVFGAPTDVHDAAGRALAAARELGRSLNSDETRVGIGVSAGPAVAGNIGDPSRYEYTVIGDPVNEAARLSELAKQSGGIAASGAALARASTNEACNWVIIDLQTLRGRDQRTEIAAPRPGCADGGP